jgi:hypothetical protein
MSYAKSGASAQVKIVAPKSGFKVPRGVLVASGWASDTIVGVDGVCKPTSGNGTDIQGLPLFYLLKQEADQRPYNWAIIFRGFVPGHYRLTVTGLVSGGGSVSDSTEIEVGVAKEFADIIWPPSHTDITDYNGDFNPWGDLFDRPLGQVYMKDSHDNVVQPLNSWGDYQVYQTWVAYFPTLGQENYSLRAEDDQGSGETVTDLQVN